MRGGREGGREGGGSREDREYIEGGARENEGKKGERGQTPHPLTPWLAY